MPASVDIHYYCFNYKVSHLTKALEPCSDSYSTRTVAVQMTDRGGMHAALGVLLRSKHHPELSDLVK